MQLADLCAGAGITWVAYEKTTDNDPYASELRAQCHAQGMLFGVWEPEPDAGTANPAVAAYEADFYIAQAESPAPDWIGIAAQPLVVPKAIVTTLWGQNAATTTALRDAGWKCLTECYIGQNPNATPDRMDFSAKQLGWDHTQPVFGVYGGKSLVDYTQWFGWKGHGIWSAEYLFG